MSKKLKREQITFLNERMRELMKSQSQVSVSTLVALSRDAKDDYYLPFAKKSKPIF